MSASTPFRRHPQCGRERGIALVTTLLLLVIITILALSMFRSFGSQEKIAGNIREKDRALHAAETAQQYAEWWLLQGGNLAAGATACAAPVVSANTNPGQICNQTLQNALGLAANTQIISVPMPWTLGLTYTPPFMSTTPGVNGGQNGQDPPYFAPPGFYIADVGPANDGAGEAYQIDAYGFGGSSTTVAIVESSYEVQQGVTCLSCG
jgi:type IV pilus assembly protein PilX